MREMVSVDTLETIIQKYCYPFSQPIQVIEKYPMVANEFFKNIRKI